MIEPDICTAIIDWMRAEMREWCGPGKPTAHYADNRYNRPETIAMLTEKAPAAIAALDAANDATGRVSWERAIKAVDDRTIGQLMQAGATKFLR